MVFHAGAGVVATVPRMAAAFGVKGTNTLRPDSSRKFFMMLPSVVFIVIITR